MKKIFFILLLSINTIKPISFNFLSWFNPLSYLFDFFEDVEEITEMLVKNTYKYLKEINKATTIEQLKEIKEGIDELYHKAKEKYKKALSKGKNIEMLEKVMNIIHDVKKELKIKIRILVFENIAKQVPEFLEDLAEYPAEIMSNEFDRFYKKIEELIQKINENKKRKLDNQNPYFRIKARVKNNNNLPDKEKKFVQIRKGIIKQNLEKLFNIQINEEDIPNIAFCLSGGGYRAMIGSSGFISGAQKIGLLDSSLYITSLSGSTWFTAPWILYKKNISVFKEILKKHVENLLIPAPKDIENAILPKILYSQKLSFVDLYGAFLTKNLLMDIANNKLSMQKNILKNAETPFPIYTAVDGDTSPYEWFEFTPYEIGSDFLKAYIPIWALGRKFFKGISNDFAPELALGYLLGIFGSAFSVNMEDISTACDGLLKDSKYKYIKPVIDLLLAEPHIKKIRLLHSSVNNYCRGINSMDIKDKKYFTFIDAGIGFNLPFPPLLKKDRKIDIIFAFDISRPVIDNESKMSPALVKAKKYAIEKNIKFPEITKTEHSFNILRDELDPETPIIVYMPLLYDAGTDISNIKNLSPENKKRIEELEPLVQNVDPSNDGFCNTLNFKYSNEEFEKLSGLAEFNILSQVDEIYKLILEVINNKHAINNKNKLLKRNIIISTMSKWLNRTS